MKFLRKFNEHTSYEAELNSVGVDISLPNVSYCKDANDVHFNPYNLIEFYVGNITGTTQQTVKIYTDTTNHLDVTVSDGNKWYSYLLPKDKGLFRIEGDSVKKVIIKADINTNGITIIPNLVVEASFKGSNTSNVTSMNSMFGLCSGLTSLNLSNFDTSKVTDMSSMFNGCSGLKSLDVGSFDTSNVTNMRGMFGACANLTSLTLSNFDTTNVTDMNEMFVYCSGLTSLDLSNFDTSKVTDMAYMFQNCSGLTHLYLRNFNTSNETDMIGMFSGCSKLTSLDLSKWNMSDVTTIFMDDMFDGCSALNEIKMIGCEQPIIDKIKAQLTKDGISLDNVRIVTE